MRLAGRIGSLSVLEHVGRRSGTVRRTPVRAQRSGHTVVVGANFGVEAAWVRNVLAAGGCRLRRSGRWLELTEPRLATLAEARGLMPWWYALGLRVLVRTQHCLVLTVADEHR